MAMTIGGGDRGELEASDLVGRLSLAEGEESFRLREGEDLVEEKCAFSISIGESKPAATLGKVIFTSQRVAWVPDDPTLCPTCSIDLSAVVIHAQSSASEEREGGLYLQVEVEADEGGDEETETLEVFLTPRDQSCLDALFSSLCDCVLMNPDEGFLGEDEDEEGEASVTVLGESAAAAPEDLDELLEGDQERFADA